MVYIDRVSIYNYIVGAYIDRVRIYSDRVGVYIDRVRVYSDMVGGMHLLINGIQWYCRGYTLIE